MRLTFVAALFIVAAASAAPCIAQSASPAATPQASRGSLDLQAAPQSPYQLLRFNEDWSFLRDPAQRHDSFDPVKYIPLNAAGTTYLSFGGEARERYEYYSRAAFGRAPSSRDGYTLQRYLVHADAHLGRDSRLFAQFGSSEEDGRAGGPRPFDRDTHDIVQLFADQTLDLTDADRLTLRVGRQEMAYGSSRLIGTGEGANTLVRFDGAHAILQTRAWRFDAFDTRPTASSYGIDDGAAQYKRLLAGMYATNPTLLGRANGLDLYYIDFLSRSEIYTSGVGPEDRRSAGTRVFGINGPVDYNTELTYQWGRFRGGNIVAYAIQTDNGITAKSLMLAPRLGLRTDFATGDQNPKDHDLQTYNPLFVAPNYYNQSSIAGPRNFVDVHPTLDLHPSHTVDVLLDWDFFWRESLKDGVYGPTGTGVTAPANGSEAKFAGSIPDFQVTWGIDRHLTLLSAFARFYPGKFLEESHLGAKTDYTTTWLDYKF